MKTSTLVVASMALLVFSGCSNKNILMPGKYQSDCERDGGTYGMCGSPKNVLKYQEKIENTEMDRKNAYHIDDNGVIKQIEVGELKDEAKSKSGSATTASGDLVGSVKGDVMVKNRGYMLSNTPKSTIIRSQEVIRRTWLNTYTDANKNLIGEHDIYVVTKDAEWNVGEKTPAGVKKAKFVPSIIAKEAIVESHAASTKEDDAVILQYLNKN